MTTSSDPVHEESLNDDTKLRFSNTRPDTRAGESFYRLVVDLAAIPQEREYLKTHDVRKFIPEIIKNIAPNENVRILKCMPKMPGDNYNPPTITDEAVCTTVEASRSKFFDEKDKYSIVEELDLRGMPVGRLISDFGDFEDKIEEQFDNKSFQGKSRLLAGLLQVLYKEINDRPSAVKDVMIILTNNYVCDHDYGKDANGDDAVNTVLKAIQDRHHCEIHIITTKLASQGVNPNSNDPDSPSGVQFLKRHSDNVFIHTYERTHESRLKIGRKFNRNAYNILLEIIRPVRPVRLGVENSQTGELTVYALRLTNNSNQVLPPKTRAYLVENNMFMQSSNYEIGVPLARGETKIIYIPCKPKTNRGVQDLPKSMTVQVEVPFNENENESDSDNDSNNDSDSDSNYKPLKAIEFDINIDDFVLGFFNPNSPILMSSLTDSQRNELMAELNIFYMGLRGTGKSSNLASIQTMLSHLNKHRVMDGIFVSDSMNDVTTKITGFKPKNEFVEQFLEDKGLLHCLKFFDLPGFVLSDDHLNIDDSDAQNFQIKRYPDNFLSYLFQGVIPEGLELQSGGHSEEFQPIRFQKEYMENLQERMIRQRPHAIVLCLVKELFEDDKLCGRMKTLLAKIRQDGVPVIINLTKMDLQDGNLVTNPFKKTERIDTVLSDCSKKLGVEQSNIIYSVSYGRTRDDDRVFEYDQLLFSNLEKIQTKAQEYAKTLRDQLEANNGAFTGKAKDILESAKGSPLQNDYHMLEM